MPFQIELTKYYLPYDSTYSFEESGRRSQIIFFIYGKCKKLFIATSDLYFRLLKTVLNPCFRFKIDYILGLPC